MFAQSIVIVFIRAFVINARRTEFHQSEDISGNLLRHNDTVYSPCICTLQGIFDFIQLFPRLESNLQNHPNTLKYYSIIPIPSVFDSDCLLRLLIRRYRFLTLIVYVVSK